MKLRSLGAYEVRLWARRAEALAEIRERGCADFASNDLPAVAREADLIILCVPVGIMSELAKQMAADIRQDAIITDVGSVKATVVKELSAIFSARGRFVGSHPMAGTEHTGLHAAKETLFHGTTCMVTPDEGSDAGASGAVAKLTLNRRHQIVTARDLARSRSDGIS